jgi:energy-coupling factor transport system permease protein
MKSIVIGQYIPGDSFLYKIDPRTKLVAILLLLVSIFLLNTIVLQLISFGIVVGLLVLGKISLKRIMRGLKPIFVLMIFTFVFQILLNNAGVPLIPSGFEAMYVTPVSLGAAILWTVLWRIGVKTLRVRFWLFLAYVGGLYAIFHYGNYGPLWSTFTFQVYSEGIRMSVFVILRLIIVLTLSTILTLTTKPTDLTQAMESFMRPLRVIGLNSDEFALIISISLRYIPTILDEANKIMLAQASRGADFSEGKLKDKIRQVVSLLVPMFIIAFKRSEDLADAMESRNFVPGKPRTRIHELRFGAWDVVALAFVLAALGTSLVIAL